MTHVATLVAVLAAVPAARPAVAASKYGAPEVRPHRSGLRPGPHGVELPGPVVTAGSKPRVAVVRMEFRGRVPEVSQGFLSERLVQGLAAAGFEVTAGQVLKNALRGMPAPESCRAQECYREIAQRLAVDYLVTATAQITRRTYDLRLELVAAIDGRRRGEERDKCELCGIQEVGGKLDKLASSLRGYVDTPIPDAARPTVESRPPPVVEPPTPIVDDGTAKAVARRQGDDATPPVARPWRMAGWGGIAAGVAAAVVGSILLSLDGREIGCPSGTPAGRVCRRDTGFAAGALLGGGAGAAAMGGLILYLSF